MTTPYHYYDWYYEPANAQHMERYAMAWKFYPGGGPQSKQWMCYAYPPSSPNYGWTYYYNPYQQYFPWMCMNEYNPNYQGWGGNNWCINMGGQFSNPGPAPFIPGTSDPVPDPPPPPPPGGVPGNPPGGSLQGGAGGFQGGTGVFQGGAGGFQGSTGVFQGGVSGLPPGGG